MKTDTLCGYNAVAAAFACRPDAMLRLFYLAEQKISAGPFCAALAAAKKPYRMVEAAELEKIAGTPHHGGLVAIATGKAPTILDPRAPPRVKLLLVLDGIGNPHNLGAIARSAAYFGVKAMLIGEGIGHALPSDAAFRTAEGGLEYLDLYRTRDLPRALAMMDPYYRTVATSLGKEAMKLDDLPRDRPVALVLGNEERGVSAPVLAACRREVKIGGRGKIQSLNVAQAAAVFIHALA